MGLGPSHDWSSHAANAFGLMALSYEDPARLASFGEPIRKWELRDDPQIAVLNDATNCVAQELLPT